MKNTDFILGTLLTAGNLLIGYMNYKLGNPIVATFGFMIGFLLVFTMALAYWKIIK
jgi:hypothetical protein